jgi:hypothetical protein
MRICVLFFGAPSADSTIDSTKHPPNRLLIMVLWVWPKQHQYGFGSTRRIQGIALVRYAIHTTKFNFGISSSGVPSASAIRSSYVLISVLLFDTNKPQQTHNTSELHSGGSSSSSSSSDNADSQRIISISRHLTMAMRMRMSNTQVVECAPNHCTSEQLL